MWKQLKKQNKDKVKTPGQENENLNINKLGFFVFLLTNYRKISLFLLALFGFYNHFKNCA